MKAPTLKQLIAIGNEAVSGKICNRCGRVFRKAIGKTRICRACAQKEF